MSSEEKKDLNTMTESYYADTAYDGSRLKDLSRQDNSKFNFTTRRLRKHPLKRFTLAQCGEFLSMDQIHIIELLNSDEKEVRKEIASPGHEHQPWETFRNPVVVADTITGVMGFFTSISWIGVLFFSAVFLFQKPSFFLTLYFLYFLLFPTFFLLCYLLGKHLIGKQIFQDKNNIILNRRKGTILCPKKNNPIQEIPFDEFDPYYNISAESSGRIGYHLCLCHRYSEEWISCPGEQDDEWGVYQLWEFWQRYMDVSKPLPDTPKMESYRFRDPVTAAYDKRSNRPADYWKNMDIEKARAMHEASIKAASNYPWGLPREHALAQGWQPSGFGEGDWQSDGQELIQAKHSRPMSSP